MPGLVLGVQSLVIRRARLPHLPEDLQPALTQASQRTGMALAFGAMGPVVGLRPHATFAAEVGPLVDRAAQNQIAGMTQPMFANLPGLDGHGRGAGMALETLWVCKTLALIADLREEAWREFGARSRQRAKEIVVGMTRKKRFNPRTIT